MHLKLRGAPLSFQPEIKHMKLGKIQRLLLVELTRLSKSLSHMSLTIQPAARMTADPKKNVLTKCAT